MRRLALFLAVTAASGCLGGGPVLTIGTTTTTQDTGLLDVLVPVFEADTRIRSRAVVGGTGQVIEMAMRADVDVLLTHSPARERALVEDGLAKDRTPVMFNLFVVAGPEDDPAGVRGAGGAADAFARIHRNSSAFVSRGDESGTHEKELAVWDAAGLSPTPFVHTWYKETGTGQGPTLMVASERGAYVLIDEATLLHFHRNGRAANIVALVSNDAMLRNQYAVVELDPAALPAPIRSREAARFADWITGPGQAVIEGYRIDGRPLFMPNADDDGA